MASGGSSAATTTTTTSPCPGQAVRDGVANESSTAVVPDWKRELIERRKSLAKGSSTPPTSGHSHSHRSKEQSAATTSPVVSSSAPARSSSALSYTSSVSSTTTDLNQSHTATPTNGTATATAGASAFSVSAGKSFDQVTSPLSSSAFSKPTSLQTNNINRAPRTVNSSFGSSPTSDREDSGSTSGGGGGGAVLSPASSLSIAAASAHQKSQQNHHKTNCAADNNNQKRNTDDSEQSVRSTAAAASPSSASSTSSFSASCSSGAAAGVVLLAGACVSGVGGGRVVKKPESLTLTTTIGRSGINGNKDSSSNCSNNNNKMVAQEVCDSAAMDAALAIGGSVVMGQCSSPDGGGGGGGAVVRQDYETSSEELKYGPGIVQKLRSRFMSYTMRLNAAKNQRPSLQNMRRATSLNNLLDDDEDSTRTASPVHSAAGGVSGQNGDSHHSRSRMRGVMMKDDDDEDEEDGLIRHRHSMGNTNGFGQRDVMAGSGVKSAKANAADLQCDGLKKYQNEMMRSRQLRRGNDSLKRARSVETLRYDSKAWERDVQMTTNNNKLMEVILNEKPPPPPPKEAVTMEDRIVKAKERGDPRPTRLKPFIDVTERPPPDLVKTTLMKFEATANRRGRAPTSRNGEVAAKVAILEKPAILHPKPPLSPKKPVIKPRTSLQAHSPLVTTNNNNKQSLRTPSPLLINVDMSYKQSTPAVLSQDRRNGTNLTSPPQTPPDLINSIGGARKESNGGGAVANNHHLQQLMQQQQQSNGGGGYESPITQLTNKLKSMQLQSPVVAGGGGGVKSSSRLIDNSHGGGANGGVGIVGGRRSVSTGSTSNSSASTASSATSSPVPHSAASGSYYLNSCGSAAGRLELGDVSAEDCYEYRDYDEEEEDDEDRQSVEEKQPVDVNRGQFESTVDADDDVDEEDNSDDQQDDQDNVDNQDRRVRLINKADLQSIGQAGTTQEFRFNSVGPPGGNKSHLPVVPPRTTGAKSKAQDQKMRFLPSGGVGGGATAAAVRASVKSGQNGHSAVQEIVLVGGEEGPNETDVDECKTTTALLIKQIKEEARKCGGGVVGVAGPRDNQVNGGLVHNNHSILNHNSNGNGHHLQNNSNHSVRNGNSDTSRQREIEKNLINVGKSELKEQSQAIQPQQQQQSSAVAPQPAKKKSWQEEPQANTMVFNFSKRKDVPDYIDSDGMILLPHRKRELPKPGESGFVVLGDISLETSTDPDDAWTMGPPSPCNILFENDNVIIEGKSNLRKQLNRSKQWSIRFDDSLTSTFEYVSESSFLEAAYDDDVDSSSDSQMSLHNGQKFMTISSAPLGSYTPMKGSVVNNFELGVTKSPSPGGSSSVSMSPSPTLSKEEQQARSRGDSLLNGGDPESLQYLKPATDDETVAWSEGTSATDLLF